MPDVVLFLAVLRVFEALVEAAVAALPEFYSMRCDSVPAPESWPGDGPSLELPLKGLVPGEQLGVAGDFSGLMAAEGAELISGV